MLRLHPPEGRRPPDLGPGEEARLPVLTVGLTVTATILILGTLPLVRPPTAVLAAGGVVLAGATASLLTYFRFPQARWLPPTCGTVTVALLVAFTGGWDSPYRSLLAVLLVAGATFAKRRDVLLVAGLVAIAALSPATYQGVRRDALIGTVVTGASWALAALIVARVAVNLRRTRDRVEQHTRFVSSVVGSLPQQVAVLDGQGTILLTNEAWDRVHALAGADPDRFGVGGDYRLACQTQDGPERDAAESLVKDVDDVLAGRRERAVTGYRCELLREPHWFTARIVALPDELGAVVTHEDVTPIRKAENTRRLSMERMRQLDRRKDALISAVSHDVRTPLSVIGGTAELLQRQADSLERSALARLADGLVTQVRRLERLLSGLMVLSRHPGAEGDRSGVGSVERVEVELAKQLGVIVDHLDTEGRPVTIHADDLVVGVDTWVLEAVVERLVHNSVRHTPPGTAIEISASLTDPRRLTLRVTDDGPGIRPDERERVFLPFEQGSHGHPHDPGAGIGLTVVRELARLHGGDAWAETGDGEGARLVVELEVDLA